MIDLIMPEVSSAPSSARRRYVWRAGASLSLFLVLYLAATLLRGETRASTGPVLAGLAGLLFLAGFAYEFVHLVRQLDELQQRIHITALAAGCGLIVLTLTVSGLGALLFVETLPARAVTALVALPMPLSILAYYAALLVLRRRYA